MKNLLIYILLIIFSTAYSYAQYTPGTFVINGHTYNCYDTGSMWSIENIANNLANTPSGVSNYVDCLEANFKNSEWVKIENVFKAVFPPARRLQFENRKSMQLFIIADALGKIKEVAFEFHKTSPITPLELYNLEIGLKALAPLQYAFPADCSGVNYRVTNSAIRIREL